jgi:hypothetical protein
MGFGGKWKRFESVFFLLFFFGGKDRRALDPEFCVVCTSEG